MPRALSPFRSSQFHRVTSAKYKTERVTVDFSGAAVMNLMSVQIDLSRPRHSIRQENHIGQHTCTLGHPRLCHIFKEISALDVVRLAFTA